MSDLNVQILEMANILENAEAKQTEIQAISLTNWPDLDVDTAYLIQDELLHRRQEKGENLIGIKMGLTSKAKQITMNVDTPSTGWVTDVMEFKLNDPVPVERLIHPRVEPEIFFTLKKDLVGPNVQIRDVYDAIDKVYAGVDVIDSRYQDFKFTLPDVVADNTSGAAFVVGPVAKDVSEVDLQLEAVLVEIDGKVVDSATCAAILSHPLEAVAMGANILADRGLILKAGWIVLAGAMTDAIPVIEGKTISFHFSTLGSIHITGGK